MPVLMQNMDCSQHILLSLSNVCLKSPPITTKHMITIIPHLASLHQQVIIVDTQFVEVRIFEAPLNQCIQCSLYGQFIRLRCSDPVFECAEVDWELSSSYVAWCGVGRIGWHRARSSLVGDHGKCYLGSDAVTSNCPLDSSNWSDLVALPRFNETHTCN